MTELGGAPCGSIRETPEVMGSRCGQEGQGAVTEQLKKLGVFWTVSQFHRWTRTSDPVKLLQAMSVCA